MTEWEWYHDINVSRVYLHLLLTANYDEKRWQGKTILRGQLITSIANLAFATDLSVQQARTAINKLKSTGEITIQSTNEYSIITICKYESYQDIDNTEQQANQQANEQTINTPLNKPINTPINNNIRSKEYKEEKKERNKENNIYGGTQKNSRFVPPTLDEVKAYCQERNNNVNAIRFINFYESKGWFVGKNKMKDWKAAVRTWEGDLKINTTDQKPQRLVGPGTFVVEGITVRLGEGEYINEQNKRHYYYTADGKRYNSEEKGFPDVPLTAPARTTNSDGTVYLRDGQCWGQLI